MPSERIGGTEGTELRAEGNRLLASAASPEVWAGELWAAGSTLMETFLTPFVLGELLSLWPA